MPEVSNHSLERVAALSQWTQKSFEAVWATEILKNSTFVLFYFDIFSIISKCMEKKPKTQKDYITLHNKQEPIKGK